MGVCEVKQVLWLPIVVLCFLLAGCSLAGGAPYTVSGRIVRADDESEGIEEVSLHFGGRRSFGTAMTGPDGTWSKDGLRGTVTVAAARLGWTFDPASRQVTSPAANVSFVGSRQLTVTPRALQIAAGRSHVLTARTDGAVGGWGGNDHGQLGQQLSGVIRQPAGVPGIDGAISVAAGMSHSLALKNDGTVRAWGANDYGQLGDGTSTSWTSPVLVAGLDSIVAVAGGANHSLALKADGTVWTWGHNWHGELGHGTKGSKSRPVQVIGLDGIDSIAVGYDHSMAVKADGSVRAWGINTDGELEIGRYSVEYRPVEVHSLLGIVAIVAGESLTSAVDSYGTLWRCGRCEDFSLGSVPVWAYPF